MKKGKVLSTFLLLLTILISFVSCSNEISESAGESSVSFAPSVDKALNQNGDVTYENSSVNDFFWEYYVTTDTSTNRSSVASLESSKFTPFYDSNNAVVTTGLGSIPKLLKGETYVFALRGFDNSSTSKNLVWEGCSAATKLTSKNQLITVDVYSAGQGLLYFNVTAPSVYGFDATSGNFQDNGEVKYDFIRWSVTKLDGSAVTSGCTTSSDLTITDTDQSDNRYYTSDTNAIFWSNVGTKSDAFRLDAGTYLMTVQQYGWDHDSSSYVAVNQRKQVLVVNIVAGVNTVVGGSLDSTELCAINYEAGDEADDRGIEVVFHKTEPTDVVCLDVSVKDQDENDVDFTTPSNIIEIEDFDEVYDDPDSNDYVDIAWTTDSDILIYVNGDEVKKDGDSYKTTATDFLVRDRNSKEETLYVRLLKNDDGDVYAVRAYGKLEYDYILTLRSADDPQKSVSFTIKGKEAGNNRKIHYYLTNCSVSGERPKKTTETSISLKFVPVGELSFKTNTSVTVTGAEFSWTCNDNGSEGELSVYDIKGNVKITIYCDGQCFAKGTKITMADGSLRNIEDVSVGDEVLTFDHEAGCYSAQEVIFTYEGSCEAKPFTLNFEDGTKLSIVGSHDLFEEEDLKYVAISSGNASGFIDRHFYKAADNRFVKLVSVDFEKEATEFYSVWTSVNNNCIADGMLSVPAEIDFLLNVYKFGEDLKADSKALADDINKYGLLEYASCPIVSEELFNIQRLKYLNIVVGKGLATWDEMYATRDKFLTAEI